MAADHKSYLLDHPDLRALLSDFVQAVLLRKPTHLIPFTSNYFEAFLKVSREETPPKSAESTTSTIDTEYLGEWGEWGEWTGEDGGGGAGKDSYRFYSVRPTRSFDGLEKVTSEEETLGETLVDENYAK